MADCELCRRPVPDVAYVCHPCAFQDDKQPLGLAPRLRGAADLWPDLLDTVAGRARMAEPGPHRRGNSPPQPIRPGLGNPADDHQLGQPTGLPFSWNASIVQEDVQAQVTSWARLVAEEHYGDRPPHGPICLECDHPTCERLHAWRRWMPPPADIPEAMRWLAAQLGWARYQPWAGEMWDALQPLQRWIENAVDRPRPRVDAGECGSPTDAGPCRNRLRAAPGAAYVHCPVCRATWSATQRSAVILAAAESVLGTATEISAWLSIHGESCPVGSIYSWASRTRLLRHGRDPETGAPRYRLGDVRRLAAERQPRRERIGA